MKERGVIFYETLRPPLWLLAFIYFLFLSLVIAVWAAIGNSAAFYTFIVATLLIFFVARSLTSHITIDGDEMRIGRAHIALKYLSECEELDSDQMRFARTQGADPAAFLALKFWIPGGVKIAVSDARDRTPYWLISSRRSSEIKRTLGR